MTMTDRIVTGKTEREKCADRVIILLALALAAVLTWAISQQLEEKAQNRLQQHLAQEVLRFHVLANSDSEADQALKMDVRAAVLDLLEEEMPAADSAQETARWVRLHKSELEDRAQQVVQEEGYAYPVNAAVTTCYFPEKMYGDVTFPAGNYEALRVEIGAAKGQNWWCVLYPSLCFLDTTNAVVPEEGKQALKNVLTEEEYEQVTMTSEFQIKWYFLEKWKE